MEIEYLRTEPNPEDERWSAPLIGFIHDVPYLGVCGVLPSLQILNDTLLSGGGDGGMGPGAKWAPFSISEKQYEQLCEEIENTEEKELEKYSRYWVPKLIVARELSHIKDAVEWEAAARQSYFDSFRRGNIHRRVIYALDCYREEFIEAPLDWFHLMNSALEDCLEFTEQWTYSAGLNDLIGKVKVFNEIESQGDASYRTELDVLVAKMFSHARDNDFI